ncbi:D-threo-aldose 1-dehydrogenase [Kushneria sinocarnis]|uniref:D-threo-aldose 1-dehydrogenase n=1 Tax=Kushneria sinocarnis TaxID=595502 RepID=A0A420WWK4_9GAMM|nr:aldo/keto reductase [Kushneria sinocarnis]RKR03492.1 D-threo-aldose 1-dehydrogenase [Kushneria sinocarnis]
MSNRREFLTRAAITAAATTVGSKALAAGNGQHSAGQAPGSGNPALPADPPLAMKRFPPKWQYGVGGTQLGNMFEVTPDDQAEAMLVAAWQGGTRYFDTSPWYGLGLSERRLGHFLDDKPLEEYVLSTKVGRLLMPDASVDEVGIWKGNLNFNYRYDYTAAGVRRSVEDSLQRLGVPKIDLVYIHDLAPSNKDLGDDWKQYLDTALKGAMPELTRMREEGIIGGWGMGVNDIEPSLAAIEQADPDVILQATQYTLLNHQDALNRLFPQSRQAGVPLVIGAPLGSGFLAGTNHWMYSTDIPQGYRQQRDRLSRIARDHGTDLRTAALQFTAAPDVVAATIPGARNADQARANQQSMQADIPAEFWQTLKSEGLIHESAPTPG